MVRVYSTTSFITIGTLLLNSSCGSVTANSTEYFLEEEQPVIHDNSLITDVPVPVKLPARQYHHLENYEEESYKRSSEESTSQASSEAQQATGFNYRALIPKIPRGITRIFSHGEATGRGGDSEDDDDVHEQHFKLFRNFAVSSDNNNFYYGNESSEPVVTSSHDSHQSGGVINDAHSISSSCSRNGFKVSFTSIDGQLGYQSLKGFHQQTIYESFTDEGESSSDKLLLRSHSPFSRSSRVNSVDLDFLADDDESIDSGVRKEWNEKFSAASLIPFDKIDNLASEKFHLRCGVDVNVGTCVFELLLYQIKDLVVSTENSSKIQTPTFNTENTMNQSFELLKQLVEIFDIVASRHDEDEKLDFDELVENCLLASICDEASDFCSLRLVRDAFLLLVLNNAHDFDDQFIDREDLKFGLKAITIKANEHDHPDTIDYIRQILDLSTVAELEDLYGINLKAFQIVKPSSLLEENFVNQSTKLVQKKRDLIPKKSALKTSKNKKRTSITNKNKNSYLDYFGGRNMTSLIVSLIVAVILWLVYFN